MIKYYTSLFIILLLSSFTVFGQGLTCSDAISISANNCTGTIYDNSGIAGNINPACFGGGTNNSMWFQFVASSAVVNIQLNGGSLASPMVALLEDPGADCANIFNELGCDITGNLTYSSLTVGEIYFVVVDGTNNNTGTFELCLTSPTQPLNDDVCNAIDLPTNFFCSGANTYTTTGATADLINGGATIIPACFNNSSTLINGVWFKFTAAGAFNTIEINGGGLSQPQVTVVDYLDGNCNNGVSANLNFNSCATAAGTNSTIQTNNLIPGRTYYILVDGINDIAGSFEICLNSYSQTGAMINDECVDAIFLCPDNNYDVTTNGATNSAANVPSETGFDDDWSCNSIVDNVIWFNFLTTTPAQDIDFSINSVCSGGSLQFEVFKHTGASPCADNNDWNSIGCTDAISTGSGTLNIPAGDLTANTEYYLIVDNYPGDHCDFDFTITGNQGATAGPDETACTEDAPFTLAGFAPVGGTWAGPGVTSAGVFDPSIVGNGTHVLYYTFGNCTEQKIVIVSGPEVTVPNGLTVCNNDCVDIPADAYQDFATITTESFSTTTGGAPITSGNPGGLVSSTMNVSGLADAVLTSICVNLTHTYNADIEMFLVCPDGNTLELTTDNGGGSDNFTGCFTLLAATPVASATGPFAGNYIPEGGGLDLLNGCSPNGTWTLNVYDDAGGDTGNLSDWQLEFENTITNITPPTTFNWSPSGNLTDANSLTPSFCPTTAGVETLTLSATDVNGCTNSKSFAITVIDNPIITPTINNETCDGLCDGDISLAVAGGVAPYTYLWDNGSTTQNISGLCDGTFEVTLTDNLGCFDNASLTITPGPLVTVTVGTVGNQCLTDNSYTFNATATGVTDFSWDFDDGSALNTTANPTHSYTATGNYTVTLTASNGSCIDVQTIDLEIYDSPAITITPTPITCNAANDGEIAVTAADGNGVYTYIWDGPAGFTGTAPNGGATDNETNLAGGTYIVTLSDGNGCNITTTTDIIEPQPILTTVTSNNVSCAGNTDGDISITLSGGTTPITYQWGTNAGFANTPAISGLTDGTFNATITDANNCSITEAVVITAPASTTITLTPNDATCGASNGDVSAIVVGGTAPYTYLWSNNETTATITGLSAGAFNLTVTDAATCSSITTSNVANGGAPLITITNIIPINCNGDNDGSAEATVSGGIPGYTFSWDNGDATAIATGLSSGNHTVTVTDSNVPSCIATETVSISEPPVLNINILSSTDPTCNGFTDGTANSIASGGTSPYSYLWNNAAITANATGLSDGIAAVTATDANNCTVNTTVSLVEPAPISITASSQDITCYGYSDGNTDITILGGTSSYTFTWSNGQLTEDLNNIPVGGFSVVVTDANNCTANYATTITQPTPLTVTLNCVDITTSGGSNGSSSATAIGSNSNYTYQWNPTGSTTASVTGLSVGAISVTITDAEGCLSIQNCTINEPNCNIVLTTSMTNATCLGATNGSATVSVISGATPPLTYLWSNGSTTATATGVSSGILNVTVSDVTLCVMTSSITVGEAAGITLTTVPTNIGCNGASTGAITANVLGATLPVNYLWNTSETAQTITSLSAGNYTTTVLDANSCIAILTTTLTEADELLSAITGTNSSCYGGTDGSSTAISTGGTAPFSYLWSTFETTQTINGIGTDTLTVSITDANGCIEIDSIKIIQPPQITVTLANTPSSCGQNNGTISVENIGNAVGTVTYLWSDPNNQTNGTASNLLSGPYTVTLTDGNGCSTSVLGAINDNAGPIVSITTTANNNCFGDSDGAIEITVTGGQTPYSYTWSNGVNTPNISGLPVGTYLITVDDPTGCSSFASSTVSEPTSLTLNFAPNTNPSCYGYSDGIITSNAGGGTAPYTYLWDNTATTAILTGIPSGTYNVTLTDNNNCTFISASSIADPSLFVVNTTGTDVSCNGFSDGNITATIGGGTSPLTYLWSNTALAQNLTNIPVGNYTISVTDNNSCVATGSTTISQPIAVTATITSSTGLNCSDACDGTASVAGAGGAGIFTYLWSPTNQTTLVATGLCVGTHTVSVFDANGCPGVTNTTITAPNALSLTLAGTNPNCFGELNGAITSTVAGGSTPYSYAWSNALATPNITGLTSGIFTETITDNNGCSISESVTLTNPTELIITTTANLSSCGNQDGDATVNVTQGIPAYTFLWGANANNQVTATANGLGAGSYSVSVTDGNGCVKTITQSVSDLNAPTITILTQSDVNCNGGSDGFAQVAISGGLTPYTYAWSNGATTVSTNNLSQGNWTATITDGGGCIAATNVLINEPTPLIALNSNTTDVTCFSGTDGAATIIGGGGTSPYTYQWNNGQTNATATGLSPTNYIGVVTDDNNCIANITVTVNEPAQITLTTTISDANCGLPTGTVNIGITNGVAPFNFVWSNGQIANPALTLIPGNVIVTVTDNDGCTASISSVVGNINGGTGTIAGVQHVLCFNESNGEATVSMSGGASPYTFLWDVNTGLQTTATVTGLSAQAYSVTVTDVVGCSDVSVVTITEPFPLNAATSVTEVTCFGRCDGEANVTVTGGTGIMNFLWDDPIAQTGKTATGLCVGDYQVTVTDGNGCNFFTSVSLNNPIPIDIDTMTVNSHCTQNDGSACISVTGGAGIFAYLWENGTTNDCINNMVAGAYSITATDQNNCAATNTVIITDEDGHTVNVSATDVSCNGGNDGSTFSFPMGGTGNFSYDWKDASNTSLQTTPNANNLFEGTYSVDVVDNNTGCTASASIVIEEPDALSYNSASTSPTCFGGNNGIASVNVAGGTSPYTYQWNTIPQQNTQAATGLIANIYTVDVADANNCSQTFSYTLTNPIPISISITPTDVLCFGACNGSALATVTGAIGNISYLWNDNQVSQTAINLCEGNYNVSVTDDNGCSAQQSVVINEPTELTASVSNFGDITCFGGNDGFIQITTFGGAPPYNYNWTNNVSNNSNALDLVSGIYTTTITDANFCVKEIVQPIVQPIAMNVAIIASSDVTCFGACNGSATASVSGGNAPYIYQWDVNGNFLQTPTAVDLCANNNIGVSVTDALGCKTSTTVDITEPPALTVLTSSTEPHCGNNDGTLQASVSGGIGPFTYDWGVTGLPFSATINAVSAGCYSLNILDANFCNYTEVICIDDIEGPTVVYLNHVDATCNGDSNGSIFTNISGGTAPYQSINWYDQNSNLVEANTIDLENIPGGMTYFVEAVDAAGCIGTITQYVDEPPSVISTIINQTNVSCFGLANGTATVVAGGGTIPYVYLWNNGQQSTLATGLNAGIFTCVVADANGCQDPTQAYVTITEPTPIVMIPTIEHVSCFDGNNGVISVNTSGGTGAYFYFWDPNQGVVTNVVNSLTVGTYNVSVIDQNNCEQTQTMVVNQPTAIIASTTAIDSKCSDFNGSAAIVNVFGGTPTYSYNWDNYGSTNDTLPFLLAGVYGANVVDANGCIFPLSITIDDQPGPAITDIVFTEPDCYGDCNASATVHFVGGRNPVLPSWSDNTGQNTYTAINLCATSYCVTLTDANGCVAVDCKFITQPDPFLANGGANSTLICDGESTQIWGSPAGGNWPYPNDDTKIEWDDASLNYNYGPHYVTPNSGMITTYNFTVTDGKGCKAIDSVLVEVRDPLVLNNFPDTNEICIGDSINICFAASGGIASEYNFNWLYDNHIDSMVTISCDTVSPTDDTWYYVTLNDGCSTPTTDSTLVAVYDIPPLQFSAPILEGCPPLSIRFSGTTGAAFPNADFIWDFENDGILDDSTHQFPTWIYDSTGVYSVYLQVRTEHGCYSDTVIENYINVYPSPTADFIMLPDTTQPLTNPLVKVNGAIAIGADSLRWQFEDPINPAQANGELAQHFYSDTGSYNIILTAINDFGCLSIDTQRFYVTPGHSLYAPNAFTPNDDNKNDVFQLKGVGITSFELFIYDRWGEEIYKNDNINKSWDGKSKNSGKLVANDVYIWKAFVTFYHQNSSQEFIGTVTVVR